MLAEVLQEHENFLISVQQIKDACDHIDTPDRDSAKNVTVFCLLV